MSELKLLGKPLLTAEELENIPQEYLPMPVLSDNLRAFIGWAIKYHTDGAYNHFMWMIHPGELASQNILYQREPVSAYTKKCRLKLWYCKTWNDEQRHNIIKNIEANINKPWYRRIYDVPAIFGQWLRLPWIQTPGLEICSDYGSFLEDDGYDLSHPDPEDVNRWLSEHPDKYKIYGRYLPD